MTKMIVRLVTKPDCQARVKALREAGLQVDRLGTTGYSCREGGGGQVIFQAMIGRAGYLVRMREDLFE